MKARDRGPELNFKDIITASLGKARSESEAAFLKRLGNDPDHRIDEVWRKVVDKVPGVTIDERSERSEFVETLLLIWRVVDLAKIDYAEEKIVRLMGIVETRIRKFFAKSILEAPSQELPKLLQEYSKMSSGFGIQATTNKIKRHFPEFDIRSDHSKSRLRTGYIRLVSNAMHQLTGEWCDDEVATLTDIAFPDLDESTTIDTVRSARRGIRS